jgi:hypothetical protein
VLVIAAVVIGLVVWLRRRSPPVSPAASSTPRAGVAEGSGSPPGGSSPRP